VANCRSCKHIIGTPFLDLGKMPLANSLLTREALGQLELTLPISVAHCLYCKLVQTTSNIDPRLLFQDYVYRSSFSDIMLAHSKALVKNLIAKHRLNSRSFVIEVASNGG
jgi:hypothetical protein